MENKITKNHKKGLIYSGKTNWSKLAKGSVSPIIDEENPELAFKKTFRKPKKNK